jgi:Ca-activated chloride channel family protein
MNDKQNSNGQGELPPEKAGIEERSMAMVTAYALDQVSDIERKAVEGLLEKNPALRQHVESIRQLGDLLRKAPEGKTAGSPNLRSVLTQKLDSAAPPIVLPPPVKTSLKEPPMESELVSKLPNESARRRWWAWVASGAIAASFGGGYFFGQSDFSQRSFHVVHQNPTREVLKANKKDAAGATNKNEILLPHSDGFSMGDGDSLSYRSPTFAESSGGSVDASTSFSGGGAGGTIAGKAASPGVAVSGPATDPQGSSQSVAGGYARPVGGAMGGSMGGMGGGPVGGPGGGGNAAGLGMQPGMSGGVSGPTGMMGAPAPGGRPGSGQGPGQGQGERPFEQIGGLSQPSTDAWNTYAARQNVSNFEHPAPFGGEQASAERFRKGAGQTPQQLSVAASSRGYYRGVHDEMTGEQYEAYVENSYFDVKDVPLSTFAIDVDTASYANMRRFLNNNQLPPPSSIRMEELLNYFTYSYPTPTGSRPFAVHLESAECPWNREHRLVRVGLKGKEIHKAERPSSNLVFLIDSSGSMQSEDKLPLLKSALTLLTRELSAKDRVTIVTYAGDAGLKLPPTSGNDKERIIASLEQLLAGGSTHGSAGIMLAYEQAKANFIQEGTNRVILCTDGDLNVGVTSDDALVELIKEQAKSGVYLSVMGFGTGNLKDGKLEKLADHGNGVYAYIDGLKEARKVFVEQMSGSLVTIAKDVKIQLEFNPKQVQSYRLLGYENRVMANQDFRNDKKDAGEIGAGHTVTALYEVVPTSTSAAPIVKLKYQPVAEGRSSTPPAAGAVPDDISKELLTVRLRYKNPEATENDPATEFETALANPGATVREASENFRFASAVAMAGLVLRNSEFRGDANLDAAIEIASTAVSEDSQGWRAEFIDLLRKAKALQPRVD